MRAARTPTNLSLVDSAMSARASEHARPLFEEPVVSFSSIAGIFILSLPRLYIRVPRFGYRLPYFVPSTNDITVVTVADTFLLSYNFDRILISQWMKMYDIFSYDFLQNVYSAIEIR